MDDSGLGDLYCEPIATRWLTRDDKLASVLLEVLPPVASSDTIVISEKVAVLLTQRWEPIDDFPPGAAARALVRFVRPPAGSRGLSVPEKMQYVIDRQGLARIAAAALASAVTRPFGVKGAFYRIAGPVARDIDGGRPPYEDVLLPPFDADDACALCSDLERVIGAGVAIVDINDFGGSVRGVSPGSMTPDELRVVLNENPLGQRLTSTPFGIIRRPRPPLLG